MDPMVQCECCEDDAEYRHWSEPTQSYWWFCEKDKCSDCEFMGWQKAITE
jgi:hypothetical protein